MTLRYPWFQSAWQQLQRMRADVRLPHALIISARAGMGLVEFAEDYSKNLLCHQPLAGGSCGSCKSCTWIAAGAHPDYRIVSFEENPATGKLRKEIVIDQARALTEFMLLKGEGAGLRPGMRVGILHPAEAINRNAANALLKIVEEPPPNRLFILVTTRPASLPATLRSRCQKITLQPSADAATQNWLAEQGVQMSVDELAAQLGRHPPLTLLQLAQAGGWEMMTALANNLRNVVNQQTDPLTLNWGLADSEQPAARLIWLEALLIESARVQHSANPPRGFPAACTAAIRDVAARCDWSRLNAAVAFAQNARLILASGSPLREQDLLDELALTLAP